jgi:hypothetical protein
VLFDVSGRRGDPGSQGDAVYYYDAAEGDAFEQVGAQRYRTADVVAGYGRSIEVQGFYKLGQAKLLA